MTSENILAVDIGSNTIKCLLGRANPDGSVERIYEETKNSRVSSMESAGLVPNAAELAADSISQFQSAAGNFAKDFKTYAVATSAFRLALNGQSIADDIFSICGTKVEILSENDEARLSYLGAMSDPSIDSTEPTAYFDLGGGSLEVVFGSDGKMDKCLSLPVGAVNITRRFIKNPKKPLSPSETSTLSNFFEAEMKSAFGTGVPRFKTLVGAGGAVVAARFAKKALGLGGEDNVITFDQMRMLLDAVCSCDSDTRERKYSVSKGRTDIVPAAFACICALMRKLGSPSVMHTFCNLRYGLVLEAGKI